MCTTECPAIDLRGLTKEEAANEISGVKDAVMKLVQDGLGLEETCDPEKVKVYKEVTDSLAPEKGRCY
ncbi:hypothetical protein V6N12_057378 [Hibiscus sabdariffa]|uniref:Uncharacterized protein n=1 Tax=Hibiscus sabdariffa TaxID=183260 RepID=A0ABR2DBP2_9ROSI